MCRRARATYVLVWLYALLTTLGVIQLPNNPEHYLADVAYHGIQENDFARVVANDLAGLALAQHVLRLFPPTYFVLFHSYVPAGIY